MKESPSIYAHLPTKELDYRHIANHIYSGMPTKEVDILLSGLRKTKKVRYHYRTSLVNLGLFSYNPGKSEIVLSEYVLEYKQGQLNLKEMLQKIVENNDDIMYVKKIIYEKGIFDFENKKICEAMNDIMPNRDINNIKRWVRPVVFLLKYIYKQDDIEDISKRNYMLLLSKIQKIYSSNVSEYGDPVAIDVIDDRIKEEIGNIDTKKLWEKVFTDNNLKYKISFITLPSWASVRKPVTIQKNTFTHIRIKKELCGVKKNG